MKKQSHDCHTIRTAFLIFRILFFGFHHNLVLVLDVVAVVVVVVFFQKNVIFHAIFFDLFTYILEILVPPPHMCPCRLYKLSN